MVQNSLLKNLNPLELLHYELNIKSFMKLIESYLEQWHLIVLNLLFVKYCIPTADYKFPYPELNVLYGADFQGFSVPQLPHYQICRALSTGHLLVIAEGLTALCHVFVVSGCLNRCFSHLGHDKCCLLLKLISQTMLSLIRFFYQKTFVRPGLQE